MNEDAGTVLGALECLMKEIQVQSSRLHSAGRLLAKLTHNINHFRELIMEAQQNLPETPVREYLSVLQTQSQQLREAKAVLDGLRSEEHEETTESSNLWSIVSGIATKTPTQIPPLWEDSRQSSPLEAIEEETAGDCAGFERSQAPSPPELKLQVPIIDVTPPTPIEALPVFDITEILSKWCDSIQTIPEQTTQEQKDRAETQTSALDLHYYENPIKETWIINSTWLSMATSDDLDFSNVESLFGQGKYQAGIAETDIAIRSGHAFGVKSNDLELESPILHGCLARPETIQAARTINLHLIKSCALLACEYHERALEVADKAFDLASSKKIYYMVSKSQLYRGLALMELGRWREASFAFTRAANVRGFATKLPRLQKEADRRLQEALMKLSLDSEAR